MTPPTWLHWPGAAPSGWTPASLSSLVAWYDASLISGSNGATITSLSDQAGSLTLSGSGTLNTSAQNGLNTLSVSTAFTASTSAFNGAASFAIASVFESSGSNVTHSVAYGSTSRLFSQNLVTSFRTLLTYPGTGSAIATASTTTTGMRILLSHNDGGAPHTRVDGTDYTGNWVVGGPFDASNNHTVTVGNSSELCEIVFLQASSSFAVSDLEKLEGYLAHKWGLTANLPTNHPYKDYAP